MANISDTTLTFTLEFKNSTQSRTSRSNTPVGGLSEIEKATFNAFNYVINDIAFYATKEQQRQIQNQIEAKMHGIVMKELKSMASIINKNAMGLGSQHDGPFPLQTLEVSGPKSTYLRAADPSRLDPMSIRSVIPGGEWRERTETYLKRKSRKYGHRRWWLNTGELRRALSTPSLYTSAYGPVRVQWQPDRMGPGGRIAVGRYSSLGRGQGRTLNMQVGTLNVSVLGRITPQMLNAPGLPAYNSKFTGLFDMMPEDVEKKLLGWYNPRPIIEPFLTFWINRQIPNKVWRTLEDSLRSR